MPELTIEVQPPAVYRILELAAQQGPPGPPGINSITLTASGAIGGHRVVIPDGTGAVEYADCSNPAHLGKVLGVTTHAAADGEPIDVQTVGALVEPSWSWSPGEVYLSTNGLMTQVPPSSGFVQVIGVAYGPTLLNISLRSPIDLI